MQSAESKKEIPNIYYQAQGIGNLSVAQKLDLMEQAAKEPSFLTDLKETMHDFRHADAECWERPNSSS